MNNLFEKLFSLYQSCFHQSENPVAFEYAMKCIGYESCRACGEPLFTKKEVEVIRSLLETRSAIELYRFMITDPDTVKGWIVWLQCALPDPSARRIYQPGTFMERSSGGLDG